MNFQNYRCLKTCLVPSHRTSLNLFFFFCEKIGFQNLKAEAYDFINQSPQNILENRYQLIRVHRTFSTHAWRQINEYTTSKIGEISRNSDQIGLKISAFIYGVHNCCTLRSHYTCKNIFTCNRAEYRPKSPTGNKKGSKN